MRPVDVFIHSSPHSGSTWFGYVLGSGSETCFVGELYRAWDPQDRVPCTVCAAKGLSECVVLAGIEASHPTQAFDAISSRNGKRVIVENSKRLDWTRQFLDRDGRDTKLLHLFKDPRSRWASLRRREAADLSRCMTDWCQENQEIIAFASTMGVPRMIVSYDVVAADPRAELPRVFRFFTSTFDDRALRYWEVEHHGFAANGASSAIIQHNKFDAPPSHFSTGDDGFYKSQFGKSFVDERWRSELPPEELEAILEHDQVRHVLDQLGYRMNQEGIRPVRDPIDAPRTRSLGARLGDLARGIFIGG